MKSNLFFDAAKVHTSDVTNDKIYFNIGKKSFK